MLHKILAVDNDSEDLFVTETILSRDVDLQIQTESDPETAIKIIKSNPFKFSVIILDYHMEKNGLAVAQEMFSINPKLQIVILSSDQSRDVLKKSIQVGVKSYIDKEEDGEVLLAVVKSLCQKWQNKTQILEYAPDSGNSNETLISSIGLIGRSQKLAEVAKLVKRAAKVDCSVVIQGESGTGKELIAKAVHEQSKRKSKPFVAINVNAIAQNLTESELFGHVKGAFTGADKDSPGKILSAQGGTLFLDEIGDLKPEIQVKLLRVLQERKLSPVGSNRVYDLDVRFISATHVDLEKAILDGKFREDLYYRLHVFPIHIPPLRERPEDIQPLVQHFRQKYQGQDFEFLMKTINILERYDWRGNIRALENEVQRLLSLGTKQIEPKHLSKKILESLNVEQLEPKTHLQFQKTIWELELEYLETNIRNAGSLREACRSIFKSAPSSIHTRLTKLREHITASQTQEFNHEQSI